LTHIAHSEKVLCMRIFLLVILLSFNLQSWTKAEDISDFQIEGISVGDSLLDYFSEDDINNAQTHLYRDSSKYPNTKYLIVRLQEYINLKQYEQLQFVILKNDKKKIIQAVEGFIYYEKNISQCSKFKDKIVSELSNSLNVKNVKVYNNKSKHGQDKSGKSEVDETIFLFNSGAVFRVGCTDWSKKMKFKDELRVVINSIKFSNYLRSL